MGTVQRVFFKISITSRLRSKRSKTPLNGYRMRNSGRSPGPGSHFLKVSPSLCVLFFLLFFLPALTGWSQPAFHLKAELDREPGSLLRQLDYARALRQERNFPPAISLYKELVKQAPQDRLLRLELARLSLEAGFIDAAKTEFAQVLATHRTDLDALAGMVQICEAQQNWDGSMAVCADILKFDEENAFAVLHTAWGQFQKRQYASALTWYSKPGLSETPHMMAGQGYCHLYLGDLIKARQAFENLLKKFPSDPQGLAGLAEVKRLSVTGALEKLQAQANLNPEEAMQTVAQLREQYRIYELLALTEAILARDPKHAKALRERGYGFLRLANWPAAESVFSALLQVEPSTDIRRERMNARKILGRQHEAALDAKEILKTAPADALALKIMGDEWYALGSFEKALDCYERALPADLWAMQGKAWCHLILGDKPKALQGFQTLLAQFPGNLSALEGLKRLNSL
jgi:tetratricopeptide (TPR) repeat protein